jgi:hypothetical protein
LALPKILGKQFLNTSCHLFLGTIKSSRSCLEFWEIEKTIKRKKKEKKRGQPDRRTDGQTKERKRGKEKIMVIVQISQV